MSNYEPMIKRVTVASIIAMIGGSIGSVIYSDTKWFSLLLLAAIYGFIVFSVGFSAIVAHYLCEDENKNNKQDKDRK